MINCDFSLTIEHHRGLDPTNFYFYNNLLISTGGFKNEWGNEVNSFSNKNLSTNPTQIFTNYNTSNFKNSDFTIKESAESTVGRGQPINTGLQCRKRVVFSVRFQHSCQSGSCAYPSVFCRTMECQKRDGWSAGLPFCGKKEAFSFFNFDLPPGEQ